MMKIALDAMGGDYAPRINVEGALLAVQKSGIPVILVGDQPKIQKELRRSHFSTNLIEIIHASENIGMHEKATESLRSKKNTSMGVALELLRDHKVDAVVSPGHTGAFMALSTLVLKRLPGIERPAIAGCIPTLKGSAVMLDLGANVDCKPSQLVQFAVMGSLYAKIVEKHENPKIGLLSNGEEESKGNELTRQVHQILKTKNLNYVGYVESKEIFKGRVDVVVCDGFTGNIFLKTIEGALSTTASLLKQEIGKRPFSKLLVGMFYLLFKDTLHSLGRRFDYAEYGSAPLLGLNGVVHVCHGRSSSKAIKNAILTASKSVETKFLESLKQELETLL
ncbi:MAG TPA: phosphate acyltransferase PlsX [Deltaproteobacteria bacterium]|nr:phosphate acyltransferase PlsX [Deltaproteobacteria bacterium]